MPIFCCQTRLEELELPEIDQHTEVNIQPCLLHGKKVQFVCNDKQCEMSNNTLLCHECLKEHRNHDWKTREQYFTRSFKSIINKNLNVNIREALDEMHESFSTEMQNSVIQTFNKSITEVNHVFEDSIQEVQNDYNQRIEQKKSQKNINTDNFQQMKEIYNVQKEQIHKIKEIQQILIKSLRHFEASIKRMVELIRFQVQAKTWRNHEAMIKFQNQIQSFDIKNQIIEDEKNYFYFSPLLKHDNIKLQSNNTARYDYSMPSKPVAMTANGLVVNHNRFGFKIVKMDSYALLFQCTTIFLGVCNEQIVKIAGMRKINEMSKGAYLISSAGWSYHHKDENYNRNDNVGWSFGEGDNIEVEVVFDKHVQSTANSKIIFTKKGRFFDSTFEMPLRLKNQQLRKLKPCVSFDAEIGAIVQIYDIQ